MTARITRLTALAAVLLLLLLPARSWAHAWELAIVGVGAQALDVTDCRTCRTTRYSTHVADPANCGANLRISFGTLDNTDLVLDAGAPYILTFVAWGKSVRLVGVADDGGLNPDNAFQFHNSSTPPSIVACAGASNFVMQDLSGWPSAICTGAVSASMSIVSQQRIGSKVTFRIRTTACGGNGTNAFEWQNVTSVVSSPTPYTSEALRTVLVGSSETVSVTVTSAGHSTTQSILCRALAGEP